MTHNPAGTFGRRLTALILTLFVAGIAATAFFATERPRAAEVVVHMSPTCGCCGAWVEHLRQNGFSVDERFSEDMGAVKARHGVPAPLASCHTALVDGYVIEGHVPASDIQRLLGQRPDARGLAVPGMPAGSPGMEGAGQEPYDVLIFKEGGAADIFARH